MASAELGSLVEEAWPIGRVAAAVPLAGGYQSDVVRIDADTGVFVARLAPPEAELGGIAWQHELLLFLSSRFEEVAAPLSTHGGRTWLEHDGHVLTVFPFRPGGIARRDSERSRSGAASLLARIHVTGLDFRAVASAPSIPLLAELDWHRNWRWDLDAVLPFLERARPAIARHATLIGRELVEARDFVGEVAKRGLVRSAVHGDYYRGNVLFAPGRVSAVLDWDEARIEWLVWELARSAWEWGKDKRRDMLVRERAEAFVRAYRDAGGPVAAEEVGLLLPFMRLVRLEEALYGLTRAAGGDPGELPYTLHNLRSLENLRRLPPLRA